MNPTHAHRLYFVLSTGNERLTIAVAAIALIQSVRVQKTEFTNFLLGADADST